jgi:cobalt/nickel transport system permease protein
MLTQETRKKMKQLGVYYLALFLWLSCSAMHIPDGYLSPVTTFIMFLLLLPFWVIGIRKVRKTMNARNVPLIALMAAFSFVIMMFNVPLPGGTTGHAVGAALAAIILGPEAATIAVSIALIIQALFFGDGGILALGANCFNMAVVVPYVAYAAYRAISRGAAENSRRRSIAAAIAGWLGLTTASFCAAVEFGIQPLLFKAANGAPLYAPYPLSISIPAMVLPHMLVASVVEGMMTALIVLYLQRSHSHIFNTTKTAGGAPQIADLKALRGLWVGLAVLVVASPLGLLAPGTAWGEWGIEELAKLGLESIPAGLEKLSGLWGAPMADYQIPALGNANAGYILSAMLGVVLAGLLSWLLTILITQGADKQKQRM